MEIWKEIPGHPGYEVSNQGQVRSYKKRVGSTWIISSTPQRVLKPSNNKNGYPGVNICTDGVASWIRLHELVLLAFVGSRPTGKEVCHADGDASNNSLLNLRYDTRAANFKDKIRHYQERGCGRFTEPEILYIRNALHHKTATPQELMNKFNVSRRTIQQIATGRTYSKYPGPILDKIPRVLQDDKTKRGSQYRGVHITKRGTYTAQAWVGGRGGRSLYLGTFKKEIDAAKAYDEKAKELWGAFAVLNFPE